MRMLWKVVQEEEKMKPVKMGYLDPGNDEFAKKYDQMLHFDMSSYIKPLKDPRSWDTIFDIVNNFYETLSPAESEALTMCLATMHMKIWMFVSNGINFMENEEDLSLFDGLRALINDLSKTILVMDREIKLVEKIEDFVENKWGKVRVMAEAGTRPQDTDEMTFYKKDVVQVTVLAIICKIFSPIFGAFMSKLSRGERGKTYRMVTLDTRLKELHCYGILKDLLNEHFKYIILKLTNYIENNALKSITDSTTNVFNANTKYQMRIYALAILLVRNYVNIDLEKPKSDLMRYTYSLIKHCTASSEKSANTRPVYVRTAHPSGDDEGNVSSLEIHSLPSSYTGDVISLIRMASEKAVRDVLETYNINEDLFKACCLYYNRVGVVPTKWNKFLLGIFYGPMIMGAKSIRFVQVQLFINMLTALQLVLINTNMLELVYMLTVNSDGIRKQTLDVDSCEIFRTWKNSDEFKECKDKFHGDIGGKIWEKHLEDIVIDLTHANHRANLPPEMYDLMEVENVNGQIVQFPQNIIQVFCRLVLNSISDVSADDTCDATELEL